MAMERIQAAIAKARASRTGQTGLPSGAEATEARWQALQRQRLDPRQMETNRILVTGHGAEATAFDVLRTRTLKLMEANGWKRLAVTSPTAGCGKSTVVLNLGLSLTRRSDISAVLIEADMRRPSIAAKLGITAPHMVAEVLASGAPLEQHALRIADRLIVGSNAKPYANPSDMLQTPQVGKNLAKIEALYQPQIMIFDMPPLLVNDDTIAFLQHVDCALLVASAEHTTITEIDTCEREIAAHTNVLGVTLNKCKMMGQEADYYYY